MNLFHRRLLRQRGYRRLFGRPRQPLPPLLPALLSLLPLPALLSLPLLLLVPSPLVLLPSHLSHSVQEVRSAEQAKKQATSEVTSS